MSRPSVRTFAAIAAGYAAALWAADALVALRYRGVDPADVAASSGMWAFGDLVAFALAGGLLCLPPTWFLFRALRDVERAWTALSWTGAAWAALGLLAALAFDLVPVPPPRGPGGVGPVPSTWPSAAALVSAAALLRLMASPGSLVLHGLAWWLSVRPDHRRRAAWAAALEIGAMVVTVGWVLVAVVAR